MSPSPQRTVEDDDTLKPAVSSAISKSVSNATEDMDTVLGIDTPLAIALLVLVVVVLPLMVLGIYLLIRRRRRRHRAATARAVVDSKMRPLSLVQHRRVRSEQLPNVRREMYAQESGVMGPAAPSRPRPMSWQLDEKEKALGMEEVSLHEEDEALKADAEAKAAQKDRKGRWWKRRDSLP